MTDYENKSTVKFPDLRYQLSITGPPHYTPDCLQYPYPYMHRLEGLRACTPTVAPQLPQELKAITTPLILPKWQTELQGHPDPTFTEFITQGIQHGFRIGFNYSLQNLKPCRKNLRSAAEHPSIVDAYLHNELSKDHLIRIN